MINVMLVDDHNLFRESLKQLIESEGDIKVICEASDGEECIDRLRTYPVDIIILDINMPQKNGIETMEFIKKKRIPVKVIILTTHYELDYMVHAVDLGVNGYLIKDCSSSELRDGILSVYDNKNYIQPKLIPMFNKYLITQDDDKCKISSLTNREYELLKAIASGKSNKDIADMMKISERTVKNHVSHIFKKIEVDDRTQAAVFAIKNDIIKIK